jgi:hypothetical protein
VAETNTHSAGEKLSIFALAAVVLATVVGGAFAIGYLIGRMFM